MASIPYPPSNIKKAWTDNLGTMWCLCAEDRTRAHVSCVFVNMCYENVNE